MKARKIFWIILGILCLVLLFWGWNAFALSSGPNYAGTAVNDTTVGTKAWTNPQNASGTPDSASSTWLGSLSGNIVENSIKIVKGNTISGTDQSGGLQLNNTTSTWQPYGDSSNLWGLTWTTTDINASTFGVSFSIKDGNNGVIGNYLKATNFGFNIAASNTINGIFAEVLYSIIHGSRDQISVDSIRITVFYTPAAAGSPVQRQIRVGGFSH